ncbi:MAG: NAD(P)H nitroreductase [Fimbriimonadales bacterium]
MDIREAILHRRSIRNFAPGEVPEEAVREMLLAAMYAPSAGNQRPWHFIVVRDRRLLDTVALIHPYAQMSKQANVGVLVCCDTKGLKYRDLWPQDLAAATQNLLLMVHGLGLGAVWTAVYPDPERVLSFRRAFQLPSYVEPFAFVPIGIPGETPAHPQRFDESRIHTNLW